MGSTLFYILMNFPVLIDFVATGNIASFVAVGSFMSCSGGVAAHPIF
jgi:hypothetical protein